MTTSYYSSCTHGRIPLSPEGKRLMQDMRNAVQDALSEGDFNCNSQRLSFTRGEIAKRMSALEAVNARPPLTPDVEYVLTDEPDIRARTIAAVRSHGRGEVLAVLRRFGAERVPELRIGDVTRYMAALSELANRPTPEALALSDACAAAAAAAEALAVVQHDGFKAIFDAGRDFERNRK